MKCIFAALPYHFSVQYHADALVASHAKKAWVINMDGVDVSYRMQECRGADGQLDPHCAVFVPSSMGRRDAGRLLIAFNAAHPGVIPHNLVFRFDRINWWLRPRRSLPPRLDCTY
jgi:hypothetical protein